MSWPMLAACLALYLLRDFDSITIDARKGATNDQVKNV